MKLQCSLYLVVLEAIVLGCPVLFAHRQPVSNFQILFQLVISLPLTSIRVVFRYNTSSAVIDVAEADSLIEAACPWVTSTDIR